MYTVSISREEEMNPSGRVTSTMSHLLHIHILTLLYTNAVRWSHLQRHCLLIRHRPEIKSTQEEYLGGSLLIQGDVAAMQMLFKLDAEMKIVLPLSIRAGLHHT